MLPTTIDVTRRLLTTAEELAGLGSWEFDVRSGRGLWSDELYRILGFKPGEVTPSLELSLDLVHPEDRARIEALLRTMIEEPETLMDSDFNIDCRIVRRDGSLREIRARGRVVPDDEGLPVVTVGFAQDMTEQRLSERELRAHYAVGQALRDWQSFEEGMVGLLRRLGTALESPGGSLWAWDDEQGHLYCRAFWAANGFLGSALETVSRETHLKPGEGMIGRAWQLACPIVMEDIATSPHAARRDLAIKHGLISGLAIPAIGQEGPVAVVGFWSTDRRVSSERFERTLTGIGRELGRYLDGRRGMFEPCPLSPRELEVLRLASEGNSGPRIAELLFVSPATVKTHFQHVYEKLGVGDRAAAVAHALRVGLIE